MVYVRASNNVLFTSNLLGQLISEKLSHLTVTQMVPLNSIAPFCLGFFEKQNLFQKNRNHRTYDNGLNWGDVLPRAGILLLSIMISINIEIVEYFIKKTKKINKKRRKFQATLLSNPLHKQIFFNYFRNFPSYCAPVVIVIIYYHFILFFIKSQNLI